MSGISIREVFGFSSELVDRAFASGHAGATRGPSLPDFAGKVAADELNRALDADVFELLGAALLKLNAIRECADRTKHSPDETLVVSLGSTELTSTSYPILKLSYGSFEFPELRFVLDLTAKFDTLQLVIRGSRIRSLKAGAASVVAKLKYGDLKFPEQSTPEWKLPLEIPLGAGIPIS